MNCPHGLDERFCSICNRIRGAAGVTPRSAGDTSLSEILEFLNDEQVRATSGAVAQALGVVPRSLDVRLGPRRPEASWIVSAENGLPAGYGQDEWHPALMTKGDVITSGMALILRLSTWRVRRGRS